MILTITLKRQIGYSENESIAQNLLIVNEARAAVLVFRSTTHSLLSWKKKGKTKNLLGDSKKDTRLMSHNTASIASIIKI